MAGIGRFRVRAGAPTFRTSSPAKAGDPVFQSISDGSVRPRRTGCPTFAEHDVSLGAPPPKAVHSHARRCRGWFVHDVFRSTTGANSIGSVSMTHDFPASAPELPAPSLTPNEIVPLLIGSTVGEIERELVLQTLARCTAIAPAPPACSAYPCAPCATRSGNIQPRGWPCPHITTRAGDAQDLTRRLRLITLRAARATDRSAYVQRPAFRYRRFSILGRSLSRFRADAERGADRVRAAARLDRLHPARRHFHAGETHRRVLVASAGRPYEYADGPQHDAQGR